METFGKTSVGGATDGIFANYQQAFVATCPAAGTITKISIYMDGGAATQVFKGAVWDDSAGNPGALLATSSPVTIGIWQAAGWVDFTLSCAVAAANYHLGYIAGTTDVQARQYVDSVASSRRYKALAYASGPGNPFGTPDGTDAVQASIYATYTPSAVANKGSFFALMALGGLA